MSERVDRELPLNELIGMQLIISGEEGNKRRFRTEVLELMPPQLLADSAFVRGEGGDHWEAAVPEPLAEVFARLLELAGKQMDVRVNAIWPSS